LGILEFLHRIVDVLEDFLGSPLITIKIEENYEVVAQLLNEMCDGGVVCNTEGNALREQIETSSGLGKLFTQVGIPTSSPALGPSSSLAATLKAASSTASGPAIPWRKQNVRHTSNELYVDIVENLVAVFAPSGRPISARADGSILFTSKISGVPDMLLALNAPGGTSTSKAAGISRTMQLPTFHPCVRLSRWKEHPGELSFVPPDGRFMLAGYETDLLPSELNTEEPPSRSERVFLPATADLRTNLGPRASDFEARLTLNTNFPGVSSSVKSSGSGRSTSGPAPFSFGSASGGSSNAPALEALSVTIPFPPETRNVTELKPSRGEATFHTSSKTVEWKIPSKDSSSVTGVASLTGTVTGPFNHDSADDDYEGKSNALSEYYDDDALAAADGHQEASNGNGAVSNAKKGQANRACKPRSISVSFNVKGWLASGIRVESLTVDVKRSKGLGDGVKPYKGVKYLTVSRQGIERRID
jgi:AP-3 complex subunit mu